METVIKQKSPITQNVADYVNSIGVNLSKMSRDTGIAYGLLKASLAAKPTRVRSLRDDEFITICNYLQKDPLDFA